MFRGRLAAADAQTHVEAMLLSSLTGPELRVSGPLPDIDITGISADSRAVRPGHLFAALPGARLDGTRFIGDAVARGAVAVLAGEAALPTLPAAIPVLRSAEPRRAVALMAARFFPGQPRVTIAVTGTSGKTSVAEFTRQIFGELGGTAASLGTMGLVRPDGSSYGSLTTPDPVSLHEGLSALARDGVTHLAMEASSHGLDQHRLDGVRLAAAAFTNFGRDHLDYHPSEQHYFAAKARLFSDLMQPGQPAVINAGGARAADVVAVARARGLEIFSTGAAGADLEIKSLTRDGFAQRVTVAHGGRQYDIRVPLIGAYQIENALVAAALAIVTGAEPAGAINALARLGGVKGRLEIVAEHAGGLAVVDYAHKPEALSAALAALRPFATGRLICVFGCGGDRDRGKRPIMGRIAVTQADAVIVTDDNPRSEAPQAIRAEILAAAPGAREIGDRAEAIAACVAMLGKGDVLLVAGKGHETGQIVGDSVLPFSDHAAVLAALRAGKRHD